MPTTAGERIRTAVRRQRTTLAAVARDAQVPAPWLRSFATDHVHKGDPQRIRRVAETLGLDYRELLALTDQLGAVEDLERPTASAPSDDVAALVQTVGRLVEQLEAERREWREERAEWRRILDRLLPGGGVSLSAEDDDPEPDPFEDSPLTEAGRAAGRLAHDDLTAEAAADPVAALLPPSAPRTPAARRSR